MIKVNDEIVKLNHFPDGTFNVKGNPRYHHGIVNLAWHYENDAEFMALAFLTRYYQAHANEVNLYLPYVPNARMDRVEEPEDIFAVKYFGQLINSLNFKSVYVMDVHSSVSVAAINNCILIGNPLIDTVIKVVAEVYNNEMPLIFFPDEGAMKRYSKSIEVPFAFGMKKRNWANGQILGYDVIGIDANDLSGKNVVICDDICSMGGTFYHAAKKLKEMGANKIYLCVTHCENNIFNGKFGEDEVNLLETGLIEQVFTTDSIYSGNSDKIVVCQTGIAAELIFEHEVFDGCEDCEGCDCDCENGCNHCPCDGNVAQEEENDEE